jgi:uncharacterized protein YdeI (YjbR/CyaY-like superfamily)
VPERAPIGSFATSADWQAWLEQEHASSDGVWVKIAKAGADEPTVSYDEALDVALCFGWIDGQTSRLDDAYWLQRFTPRRKASRWSQRNRGKAEALIAAGRMHEAGLREVQRARDDGRWDAAYAGSATITVPDDLASALAAEPAAAEAFAGLDSRNRYSILYRVGDAKRPETRARRIAKYVAMLAAGDKLYP